jgi:hypothetical protein
MKSFKLHWFIDLAALLLAIASCKQTPAQPPPKLIPKTTLSAGQPVQPCPLHCSDEPPAWPEPWKMELVNNEEWLEFASRATDSAGLKLSLSVFEWPWDEVPVRGRKRHSVDLGDKVMECLTGDTRQGIDVTCHVSFRSRKRVNFLRIEYRGRARKVIDEVLRFVGNLALVPADCGKRETFACNLCGTDDFRFIEAQERIALDDLLLLGKAPIRPPAWPPALPPDQDKPAPTCNKPERVEAPVDPAGWCHLRFGFAKGSAFELTNLRRGQRPDCDEATIVVKGPGARTIGTLSSCNRELPRFEAEDGAKAEDWKARGWHGEASVKAADREFWRSRAQLRPFVGRFPLSVSLQTEPLDREAMRAFLLALSNGGFYPADCTTSVVPGACDPCAEIQANRDRWHDPTQDLLRLLTAASG